MSAIDTADQNTAIGNSIQPIIASEASEMGAAAAVTSLFEDDNEADRSANSSATDSALAANSSATDSVAAAILPEDPAKAAVEAAPTDLADEVAKLTVKVEDLTGRVNALTGVSTGGKKKQRRGGKSQRTWKKTKGGRQTKKRR